jgi:hypothetical protein
MKPSITSRYLRLYLLTALSPLQAGAQNTKPGSEAWFSERYLEGIGFVVLGAVDSEGKPDLVGCPKEALRCSQAQGWNPLLAMCTPDGQALKQFDRPVLLLRIQDKIEKVGKDAGTASFSIARDYQNGSDSEAFSGAIILDLFTPGIGNSPFFAYDPENFAFNLRAAAAFSNTSSDGVRGTDRQEFFFGANFLAPILDTETSTIKGALASQMTVGFKYTEDRITDQNSSSFSVEWKPALRKLFGREIPLDKLSECLQNHDHGVSEGTPPPRPPSPGTTSLEKAYLASTDSSTDTPKVFFQPTFELENFFEHATGRADGICGCAGLDSGITLWDDRLRFTYSVNLAYDFENSDDFVFHSLGGELKPLPNSAMSITAKYVSGERAPTYTKEELFELGIGLRF